MNPYLVHFSTTSGLTALDPEFQGTAGKHSPEAKHGKPIHPRVYFYEEGTPTESVVTGGAKSKYIVKHPGHDKIIDIANDLENQQQAKQQWLQKPIGSMQDAYFKLLKEKGYLGFKNSASGLPNVVALFHATPVHAEIPMPKDMTANKDWTEASVPMSLKKSDVKEAVEAIKGPAKVNEVLSEAKPDMRSKILAALRKEKLAKMNGTGTPGAGGATPPMMRPPVPAAPASMAMSKADESESRMAKKDLKDIMEYAQALDKMVVESEDLEDWVDSKITVARQYLSDIAHYLSYEHGQPTEELDKGDVISMKDKKVISTDTKAAPKELVAQQPKAAKNERALAQRVKSNWEGPRPELAKSDSKKAKFERCVLAVKKKSGDKVNPWAVCHASVDSAKKSEDLEKADMKVKEQEKPTKGMPQAKQLKADADLEKIKEGAENVAKAADKKKSELNKSGYFKEDKKTQLPKWHDPLQEQRESAAQEEQELRPESKMHIWAMLEREKQQADKAKTQKPKEELEKGKNVRKQREAVFGGWKTSAGSPRREKQIAALTDMIKRRFGLEAKRAPGKVAASGKVIDKPNFHDNVVEHIGNPDSLVHEVGHLYQYGKDMESIDPRKEFKAKEQSLSDWQKDMDTHWGDINVKHGYKKQAQTAEEYEPTALENYYRRRAGLPTHQKTASTEEENRIESEKRGKKYKKPEIPRTQAVDDPSKEIVQKVKVKGKDGKEKEIWLTGSMKNLTNKTRELVDQIDRGELMLDPTRGFVEGTSVDAKINRRARAASQDKTRKDADTLMRSDEVLEKKLILGEGKPSKATKKATPEEHKTIMDKLSTALDTVKVDTSPEATKERKMLLEHVKHKLKGQK
jgi:ribosomal protein S8